MSCYYPKLARRFYKNSEDKWVIKFIPERVDYNINYLRYRFGDDLMLLPCGRCLGCKFDKAKDWATRSVLEMKYHSKACFVTLTYDDTHLPKTLVKSHVQDFLKKLRNRGEVFRYIGAGEYGETTHRPHYHLILFGYRPDDLIVHSKGSQGDLLYESPELAEIWSKGFVIVGDVTYQSAGYVARYTVKKVGDTDNFFICSNRPGIGYQYYVDHSSDMVKTGFVYGDFGDSYKAPIPRYFEKFLLNDYPMEYDELIKVRMKKVLNSQDNDLINHKFTYLEQLKLYNAEILDRKLSDIHRR